MKHIISKLFFLAIALLGFVCCNKEETAKEESVVGNWELVSIETKSATIGTTTVTVTLSFLADGTFTMTQLIGEGRASEYSGTYLYSDGLLSGKYSDGQAWGDTYSVAFSGDKMMLTSSTGKETDTYKKI